jgi:hypothetical protein
VGGCDKTNPTDAVPTPTAAASLYASPSPCTLFHARGVSFTGCANAVIRVTSVSDRPDIPPRFEISTDGKNYTPYDPTAHKAPIGLTHTFGEGCSGCGGFMWRIDVSVDSRLSTLLAVCRSGPIDPNQCEDMGSPSHLGSSFRIPLRHNGEWEYLYLYHKSAA